MFHTPMQSDLSTDDVRRMYNRRAAEYRKGELLRTLLGEKKLRRQLMAKARGKILDVACGTGEFFPFLAANGGVTAIDLSEAMLAQARARAASLGVQVDLRVMDAQHLDFADHSFDTVITALSTCTFPDPVAALREMARVCQPDGQILLLEHGRSRFRLLARYQDRTAPRVYSTEGCRWNQDPVQHVQEAGLNLKSVRRMLAGILYVMEAAPPLE